MLKMQTKGIIIFLLFFLFALLVMAKGAEATTYTVKQTGGNYATITACAAAAVAGDICSVYNGNYAGFTPANNGNSGSGYITFEAATGQAPVITSSVSVLQKSYIVIKGFSFNGGAISGASSGSQRGSHISVIDNSFSNLNTVVIQLNHDDVLISGNIFNSTITDDLTFSIGHRIVIRNNTAIGLSDTYDKHLDFFQSWSDAVAKIGPQYVLIENNSFINISGGNSHFFLINGTSDGEPTINTILRYNNVYNTGSGFAFIDNNSAAPGGTKNVIYNNTIGMIFNGNEGSGMEVVNNYTASANSSAINNILYNSINHSGAEGFAGATGWSQKYDLYYDPNYTMTFAGLAANETGAVKNQNPLLANPTNNDFSIAANSPAIDAGGPLTTVAALDAGSDTSLIVADAHFFQPGWAGTEADWIAVGTVSNAVQISSIDYNTNTIALKNSILRNNGQPVWLYKKSDGAPVLSGSAPDIGAYEYISNGGDTQAPAAPRNIRVN